MLVILSPKLPLPAVLQWPLLSTLTATVASLLPSFCATPSVVDRILATQLVHVLVLNGYALGMAVIRLEQDQASELARWVVQ